VGEYRPSGLCIEYTVPRYPASDVPTYVPIFSGRHQYFQSPPNIFRLSSSSIFLSARLNIVKTIEAWAAGFLGGWLPRRLASWAACPSPGVSLVRC